MFLSVTLLCNNRVVVCGYDFNKRSMVKCFDIRTGMELHSAKLKRDARGIDLAEVKHADTWSLAVSFPYVYLSANFNILIFNSRIWTKE